MQYINKYVKYLDDSLYETVSSMSVKDVLEKRAKAKGAAAAGAEETGSGSENTAVQIDTTTKEVVQPMKKFHSIGKKDLVYSPPNGRCIHS